MINKKNKGFSWFFVAGRAAKQEIDNYKYIKKVINLFLAAEKLLLSKIFKLMSAL